jgi:hypothetical protein
MTTVRMEVYGARNFASAKLTDIETVAPGVGRMTCLECDGDPEAYAARFRDGLAPMVVWTARTAAGCTSACDVAP